MNKSVLHFRIESPSFKSEAIAKAWIELGWSYYGHDWQRTRFEFDTEFLRRKAIELAREIKPDVIFCNLQNKDAFDAATFAELQKYGFVINYTCDVRGLDEMQWMYEVAPLIGHTVFACKEDVDLCLSQKIENVSCSHSSCDMELFTPTSKPTSKVFDVIFCGSKYSNTNLKFPLAVERDQMVDFLEHYYGSRFMAYGLGRKGNLINPEVEVKVYHNTAIAINQNNFNLTDYTSDRIWKIMAAGTFCLTKYFPGIENIFQKEIHLDWFNDFDEMKTLIDYYLMNEEERNEIAAAGCRLVRENHDWKARISEILKKVGKLELAV